MATGSGHWRRDAFLPGAEAVRLCSSSLSEHTVNVAVTFVLSALGCFPVPPTAVLCGPSCQGFFGLVWLECRGPFHKGRTGGKSIGYGLPHTGYLCEQQIEIEGQTAGDRQELAHGSGAGMGMGSRILSAAAEGSPKVEIPSCLSLVGEAGAWRPLLAL